MKNYLTETDVRFALQLKCDEVIKQAKETVGEMIQQVVFSRGDDTVGICNDCLTIMTAFIQQIRSWQTH